MRDVPADLQTHFGLSRRTFTFCLEVTPSSGIVEGYTALDRDLTTGGVTYYSNANIMPSAIPTTLALSQLSADCRILFEVARFTREKVEAAYYERAQYRMFALNYRGDLTQQVDLMGGLFGKIDVDPLSAMIQLQDWGNVASLPIGYRTSQLCQVTEFGRGFCKNELNGGPSDGPDADDAAHHRDGTCSSTITSARDFVLSGIDGGTTPDNWASNGVILATSGANNGLKQRIKIWYASGRVTLALPYPHLPQAGDTFTVYEGCDRTWAGPRGCQTKNNTNNFFMAYPFIPLEALQKRATTRTS